MWVLFYLVFLSASLHHVTDANDVIERARDQRLLCILPSDCPVGCTCHDTTAHCNDVSEFPDLPGCVTHVVLDGGCFKGKGGNEECLRRLEAKSFRKMRYLIQLKILNTKLETLPKGIFYGLYLLEELHLHGNRLILSSEITHFSDLVSLKRLSLSNNHITYINDFLLFGLRNLEVLDLSNNFIRCIPESMYNQLPRLKTIVLTHNKLLHFLSGTAQNARNLEVVHLENNNLVSLSINVFDGLFSLKEVFLELNELECSCDMYKLILKLMEMNVFVEGHCTFNWQNKKSQKYHLTTIPRHVVCPDLDTCPPLWVLDTPIQEQAAHPAEGETAYPIQGQATHHRVQEGALRQHQ